MFPYDRNKPARNPEAAREMSNVETRPCFCPTISAESATSFWKRGPCPPRRVNCFLRPGPFQRVSEIGVRDGLSDGEGIVATFFLIKYQIIVASRRDISFARQFSSVSLTNKTEINFAAKFFAVGLFITAVQQNFRDILAKCSEANP
jgi:hypothetical protein